LDFLSVLPKSFVGVESSVCFALYTAEDDAGVGKGKELACFSPDFDENTCTHRTLSSSAAVAVSVCAPVKQGLRRIGMKD
jgi:hypothetical protein